MFVITGCSDFSISEKQYYTTIKKIECYKDIIEKIKSNTELQATLIKIRNNKKIGDRDPITVKHEYRLINFPEFESLKEKYFDSDCIRKIRENNDFLGIRYVNSELIIIEIDRFQRRTLLKKFSKERTVEIHRLIFSNQKPELTKYSFGGEKEVLYDTITDNCYYQITNINLIHGNI